MTQVTDKIDDDVFEYTPGGMSQCISGFGRNFITLIREGLYDFHELDNAERLDVHDRMEWHVNELVKWCREFNRVRQEHERTIAILEGQLAMAQEISRHARVDVNAPDVAHRALALCERCAGLPELSINRCPMCRCLQELLG